MLNKCTVHAVALKPLFTSWYCPTCENIKSNGTLLLKGSDWIWSNLWKKEDGEPDFFTIPFCGPSAGLLQKGDVCLSISNKSSLNNAVERRVFDGIQWRNEFLLPAIPPSEEFVNFINNHPLKLSVFHMTILYLRKKMQ